MTDANASAPIPEQVHDILTDLPTGFVATMRPDGMLSVTPVWLMFDGDVVRFSTTPKVRARMARSRWKVQWRT